MLRNASIGCTMLCFALVTTVATAQTFNGSSSGGFTRATGNRAGISRDGLRVADASAAEPNAPNIAGDVAPLPTNNTAPVAPKFSGSRPAGPLTPIGVAQGQPNLGRITAGNGVLPNDAGQVWREYDLAPYTSRLKDVEKPEQAIIDWILRDTGTDAWFSSPLGILSADKITLRVYHTPQVQEVVKGVYDRFMSNSAEMNRLGIRIVTVNSPSWRSRALPLMKPVEVKSSGVEAWLLPREYAVVLMNELRQRPDVKEQNSGLVEIVNGQSKPLGLTRPRSYVRSLRPRTDGFGAFEADTATIDEGYAITLSPLAATDGKTLDLVVKCNIDQVERLIDVPVDVPSPLGATQRITLQVPQLVSWRLHERFRWPTDQVLLLSCGVVAAPGNDARNLSLFSGLAGNPRSDALLFIEPILGAAPLPLPSNLTNAAGANPWAMSPALTALPNTSASMTPGSFAQPLSPTPFAATPYTATPRLPQGRFNEPWRR